MPKTIFVSVFNNLYTDQRVEKTCATLYKNGYSIFLIGNNWGGSPVLNRPYVCERLPLRSKMLKLAYIEYQLRLFWLLFKNRKKIDLLWANDIDTILPNTLISKWFNIPIIMDNHEIFTEMPSVKNRKIRHVWKWVERFGIRRVKHFVTYNESYKKWYSDEYGIESTIVRNVPFYIAPFEISKNNNTKIIIYQGMLNISRGIERMIFAMNYLPNCIFQIVGDGPMTDHFKLLVKKLDLEKQVQFLGKKSPEELREITKYADLGLSIEENNGLSYYYSFPNKVSDYIQSQVPILCSDFPEMRKVVETYHVGDLLENHDEKHIAKKVNGILNKGREFYLPQLLVAKKELCWENDEKNLLEKVAEALKD